jgi:hypothetical protein
MANWKLLVQELCDTISKHLDEPKTDVEPDLVPGDDSDFIEGEGDEEFIFEMEQLNKQLEGFDYFVTFKLKHDGSLGFDFQWAEDVNPAVASNAFANFLFLIHNGKIKNQFIEGLRAHGIQTGTTGMTDLIMTKFMAVDDDYAGNKAAVNPIDVFGPRE